MASGPVLPRVFPAQPPASSEVRLGQPLPVGRPAALSQAACPATGRDGAKSRVSIPFRSHDPSTPVPLPGGHGPGFIDLVVHQRQFRRCHGRQLFRLPLQQVLAGAPHLPINPQGNHQQRAGHKGGLAPGERVAHRPRIRSLGWDADETPPRTPSPPDRAGRPRPRAWPAGFSHATARTRCQACRSSSKQKARPSSRGRLRSSRIRS